jgi:hypothetical protein
MKCYATFYSFFSNNGTQQQHASSSDSLRQVSFQFGTRPKLNWFVVPINRRSIKCKIYLENISNEQILVKNWMENHTKEAQWLFSSVSQHKRIIQICV